jgi:hypothetical protein
MNDYVFELDHWVHEFPLAVLRKEPEWQDEGYSITSPFHVAIVEQIRREALAHGDVGRSVPTDVFVFGKGEPMHRWATKVGGLPFRPAGIPWPTTSKGKPMTFVAQICFSWSRDIIGPLPGDVMLVFAKDNLPSIRDADSFRFEWYSLQVNGPLVTYNALPAPAWRFVTCYGVAYRTMDYPEAGRAFAKYQRPYNLDVIEGTKIAGVPRWIQKPARCGGRVLCTLGSIQPVYGRRFPWINQAEPEFLYRENLRRPSDDDMLLWGDCGTIYLFLGDDGQVQWEMQDY